MRNHRYGRSVNHMVAEHGYAHAKDSPFDELPAGWEPRLSKSNGRTYFVHPRYGATWAHPGTDNRKYSDERGEGRGRSRSSRRQRSGSGSDPVLSTSSRPSMSSSSGGRALHRQNSHSTPSSGRFSRNLSRSQSPNHFRGSRERGTRAAISGSAFGSIFRSAGPPRNLNIPLDAPQYLRDGIDGYADTDQQWRESRNDRKTKRSDKRHSRIPPDLEEPSKQRDRDYAFISKFSRRQRHSAYDDGQIRDDDDDNWDRRRRSRSSSRDHRRSKERRQDFQYDDAESESKRGDPTTWRSPYRNRSDDFDSDYLDKEGTTFDEATTLNESIIDTDTADFRHAPNQTEDYFWQGCC